MYHIFFSHSSVGGHLGCFHVLAIINIAAVNIGVHVSFGTMFFSVYMPRSRITGSYGSSIFKEPPHWSPGEGNGNPLQYSCLENPMDRGAWWAAVHGVTQSRTRLKWLSMHACIGERNGSPLHYSWLENPRDRGAWWAAICGVTQSWTLLKWLSSSSSILVSTAAVPIYIPTKSAGEFPSPCSLQHLCFVISWCLIAILTSARWYLIIILTCISLITSSVEHLFMCLLAIFMSSLEKCLFKASKQKGIDCLFWFYYTVCKFWRLIPYQSHHLQTFLPICGCLFILFIVSFAVQKLLRLSISHLFIFAFVSIILGDG